MAAPRSAGNTAPQQTDAKVSAELVLFDRDPLGSFAQQHPHCQTQRVVPSPV